MNPLALSILIVGFVGSLGFGAVMAGVEQADRRAITWGALILMGCYCAIIVLGSVAALR